MGKGGENLKLNKKIIMLLIILILTLIPQSVFAGGGDNKDFTIDRITSLSYYKFHNSSKFRANTSSFDHRHREGWRAESSGDDKTWWKKHYFNPGANFDLYIDYYLREKSQGDARLYVQRYQGGWKTIWYRANYAGWSSGYNYYFSSAVLRNLPKDNYRILMYVEIDDGGFWYADDVSYSIADIGVVESDPPYLYSKNLYYRERDYKNIAISVGGEDGGLSCSGNLLSGMSVYASGGYCRVRWNPWYTMNNTTGTWQRRKIKITARNSFGLTHSRYYNVYIRNRPYPISNINYSTYTTVGELPSKPGSLGYDIPTMPTFDPGETTTSQVNLANLSSYTFKTVSVTPPHPGNDPFMKSGITASLTLSQSSMAEINNSLEKENINGYDNLKKQIVEFNKAKDVYEDMKEFLDKQYDVPEEEQDLYYDGLNKVVDYNNQTNILDQKYDLENDTDYENIKNIYKALKTELAKRQTKVDHNNKEYEKYKDKVKEYNQNLSTEIDQFINNFKNNYISSFNSWKNDRDNYLNDLSNAIDSGISRNNTIYNNKVNEINRKIGYYGQVSLAVRDITSRPNSDLVDYENTQIDKFDNRVKIPNVYHSVKNNSYLSNSAKNSIKNMFDDGVYSNSRYDWLKSTMYNDLKAEMQPLTDYNEDYRLK